MDKQGPVNKSRQVKSRARRDERGVQIATMVSRNAAVDRTVPRGDTNDPDHRFHRKGDVFIENHMPTFYVQQPALGLGNAPAKHAESRNGQHLSRRLDQDALDLDPDNITGMNIVKVDRPRRRIHTVKINRFKGVFRPVALPT